jgi:hypothetical protein
MRAMSAMSKYKNIDNGSEGGGGPRPTPFDNMGKMKESSPGSSGGGFYYYGSPIHIEGSGLSAEELEAILERRLAAEREKMEECFDDYIEARGIREMRLSNA